MRSPLRGAALAQFLIAVPAALVTSGCCGDYEAEVVYSIGNDDYDVLNGRYGTEDLPDSACSQLCVNRDDPCHPGAGGGSVESDSGCRYDLHRFSSVDSCHLTVIDENAPAIHCDVMIAPEGCGRRPEGLATPRTRASNAMGAWLAAAAHLEAASVVAFERVAREVSPSRLKRAARAAAADEIRHAQMMAALARRYGAQPPPVHVEDRAPRTLEALAIDNAAEGCVREAFGAIELAFAARRAKDARVRAAFERIARDEARHAAFSFDLHDWATRRLDERGRARACAAMRGAIAELKPAMSIDELGLPDANHFRELLERAAPLWAGSC